VQTVADSTPGEDSSSEDSNADPKITKLLSSPGGATPRTPRSRSDDEQRISGLLAAAVSGIGGTERSGQTLMAHSVWAAMENGDHLAVQAGTGTGKSLAYLVPAFRLAADGRGPIVVSTATIALQRQLVDRDLPRLAEALREPLGRAPRFAIFKGRGNYVCKHKLRTAPEDSDSVLFSRDAASGGGSAGGMSAHVKRLNEWAERTSTGDRDELVPGVPDLAWRQASVTARECIGASKCGFGQKCFAERAKRAAAEADIVVTNHALLAIDALGDGILPEHDVVIVDEAHELVDRVTSVASGELSVSLIEIAQRRTGKMAPDAETARLADAGAALSPFLSALPAGRMDALDPGLATALEGLRDAAQACAHEVRKHADAEGGLDAGQQSAAQLALVVLDDIAATAERVGLSFEEELEEREEVAWIERSDNVPAALRVAPLEVAQELAEHLFGGRTVILTSATLTLGGSFEPLAKRWGLDTASKGHEWDGIDVGSPFTHGKSGILYVARHLPPPGRDRLSDEYLQELWELIQAAGGRTLGLFSSMRAAKQATAALRDSLKFPLLCQGDDATGLLVKQFAADEPTCLFGTLSLWQGVDVPGPSLRLVAIDRIPFPRPDDPLASARSRAAEARGENGFMEVSAAHAALLLAQGAGRLLRSSGDRGVVAVLDPRLVTKRYGEYLRASLPPFWQTTDPEIARGALRRLAGEHQPGSPKASN
jgi:ATP-dependent DNA helicase DinG